ncbi:hypothetical protein [Yinghuangia seranimata]|uniref:hypothetical protein n=1 Tax=Yinghuangia seranimata TaxID=408067 RepID=UPI00248C632B|nr:hypothetical protein [Yinghuangia seranimata]MDI2131689.1 hypothetical protein [Yinghuangia seranimata]
MAGFDASSRYAGSPVVRVPLPDGTVRAMTTPRTVPAPGAVGPGPRYQVRAGDRLDLLAHAVYADSTQWWRLADANPFADACVLEEPGRIMRLPQAPGAGG